FNEAKQNSKDERISDGLSNVSILIGLKAYEKFGEDPLTILLVH
ncbi:24491_t:CDS:1, partial [Gigaspora rosea]